MNNDDNNQQYGKWIFWIVVGILAILCVAWFM